MQGLLNFLKRPSWILSWTRLSPLPGIRMTMRVSFYRLELRRQCAPVLYVLCLVVVLNFFIVTLIDIWKTSQTISSVHLTSLGHTVASMCMYVYFWQFNCNYLSFIYLACILLYSVIISIEMFTEMNNTFCTRITKAKRSCSYARHCTRAKWYRQS